MRTLATLLVLALTAACHRATPPYVTPPDVGHLAHAPIRLRAQAQVTTPTATAPARP